MYLQIVGVEGPQFCPAQSFHPYNSVLGLILFHVLDV